MRREARPSLLWPRWARVGLSLKVSMKVKKLVASNSRWRRSTRKSRTMAATRSRSMAWDGVWGDAVHVVPEALAGQLGGLEGKQAVQDGALEPGGKGGLGAGIEAAVEDGDEQVGADGGAGAALGEVAVDDLGEAQAAGEVEEGGDGAEVTDGGLGLGGGGGLLEFGDDVVGATEVDLADDFGACR